MMPDPLGNYLNNGRGAEHASFCRIDPNIADDRFHLCRH